MAAKKNRGNDGHAAFHFCCQLGLDLRSQRGNFCEESIHVRIIPTMLKKFLIYFLFFSA